MGIRTLWQSVKRSRVQLPRRSNSSPRLLIIGSIESRLNREYCYMSGGRRKKRTLDNPSWLVEFSQQRDRAIEKRERDHCHCCRRTYVLIGRGPKPSGVRSSFDRDCERGWSRCRWKPAAPIRTTCHECNAGVRDISVFGCTSWIGPDVVLPSDKPSARVL